MENREAIAKCQSGDKEAFGILVEKYMKRAYFTALALLGSHEDALDLSQEAFVRAFKAIARYDGRYEFFTWFYRILRNLCLNYIRNGRRRSAILSDYQGDLYAVERPDPSVLAERSELREIVWKGLSDLEPDVKEIIILKDIQGLSYSETALVLDCPIGTVMSRLFNARKALKEKLERYL